MKIIQEEVANLPTPIFESIEAKAYKQMRDVIDINIFIQGF